MDLQNVLTNTGKSIPILNIYDMKQILHLIIIYVSKLPNKLGSFKRTSYLCSEKRKHNMAYAKIDIVIKKPSQKLEERIREVGRQKYERMQKTLHDWKEGKYKNAKVLLVK